MPADSSPERRTPDVALVTGLPRSGTTLTCELLNRLDDVVALDEPMVGDELAAPHAPSLLGRVRARWAHTPERVPNDDVCDNIEAFALAMRRSLLSEGTAVSKHVDGQIRGTKVPDRRPGSGLRTRMAYKGVIRVDKQLAPDFLLVMKHNSAFAGVVDRLVRRLPVYAIVRNPLSVLSSWQTVPFPIQRGHANLAERFDPQLARDLEATPDRLDRQFHLLAWFFGRFRAHLPAHAVIRYEDIVASGGGALAVIAPSADRLHEPLRSRNAADVYDRDEMNRIAERLLATDGPWWDLYSRASVEDLVAQSGTG
jgi:hypothetical protein